MADTAGGGQANILDRNEDPESGCCKAFQTLVGRCQIRPMSLFKWLTPVFACFMSFCFQSVMLHLATMNYVWSHTEPLSDMGHRLLGEQKISMKVLDCISMGAMAAFMLGALVLRDLRLWIKVFSCASMLFFWKGVLDYITIMPDSIGWENCKERLTPAGDNFFQGLQHASASKFWRELLFMEFNGIFNQDADRPRSMWPVRYCGDMMSSGHTFVMFLYLLATCDLARRMVFLTGPFVSKFLPVLLTLFTGLCVCTDLYLIVVNHFHYTVDVVVAIMLTLLFYTNSALAVFTDWFVDVWEPDNQRHTIEDGMIWIPPFCFPFCCFNGYYEVKEMSREDVLQRQEQNYSSLFSTLLYWADFQHCRAAETTPLLPDIERSEI